MWFRFLGGLGLYMAKILGDFPLILCIFLCILGSYNRSLSFGSLKPEKNLQYAHGHHAVLPTSACFCIPFILECRCSCLMDDTVIIYLSISMWGGHSFLLFSFVDAVFRWFLRSICCISEVITRRVASVMANKIQLISYRVSKFIFCPVDLDNCIDC